MEAESLYPESLFEDRTVSNRTIRNTEQYSQFVSGWNKVLDALNFRKDSNLDPQLKDDIRRFNVIMKILIPLLGAISKWKTEDFSLKCSPDTLAYVLAHIIQDFAAFGLESLNSYSNAAGVVVSNLKELRIMKPEIGKMHSVVSGSSKPLTAGEASEVVSFINLILENLNNVFSFSDCYLIFLKEQLEALQKELSFLRNFLGFLSEICILPNSLVDLLSCAEACAVEAACLLYLILVDRMNGEDMAQNFKTKLVDVVEKIKPFSHSDVKKMYVKSLEASRSMIIDPFVAGHYALRFFDSLSYNLRELSIHSAYVQVAIEEPIESLLEKLSSMRCCIEETPSNTYKEELENFRTVLLDLIIDLGCFICTYPGLESTEKLGHLLDKIQFIESVSGDLLIPRSWQTNFPTTNELGFVDFILMNLRERIDFNMVSTDLQNGLIGTIYEELVALRHDFGEIGQVHKENEELRALFTHYKDVAYQAEYLVDLSLYGVKFSERHSSGITSLRESIMQISGKVKAITMKKTSDNLVHNIEDCPGVVSLEDNLASTFAAKSAYYQAGSLANLTMGQLVGLERDIEDLKGQLMRGSKQLKVLSIVGMPGIGKTTLANLVYRDPTVTLHFHVLAWCSVSQVYQKENLLNDILHRIRSETSQECESGLDQQVYQNLKGRRYLVIFDDVWDTEVWDCLRPSFPNDSNGSRVIFTTRNHDVAFHANSVPHALRLLSEEESWKLLQVKLFKEETCPPGLLDIGKRIAINCKGLPLSIVLVAGLLKTTERNQYCWERVGYQLRSYVANNRTGQQMGILELSYARLPDHLKPCFLYFGAFAEDAEIPEHKLLRLWIAEGFVKPPKVEQNSLENEAEKYLNDLINRSLVMIAKRSSRGGVKTCQVHDLIHEFCLVRGGEERFLLRINRHDKLATFKISEVHEQYRLSIHSNSLHSVKMGHFESRVRTLLFPIYSRMGHFDSHIRNSFGSNSSGEDHASYSLTEFREMSNQRFWLSGSRHRCHQHLYGVYVMVKFKLLRVLDLGASNIVFEEDFSIIVRLLYLRYLAIQACTRRIPAEIANLKNLETFLVSTATLESSVLAKTILTMGRLRHLHIGNDSISSFYFKVENPNAFEESTNMESLTTLSTPRLSCDEYTEKIMRKFPNLQKLKCRFLDSWDDSEGCNNFPVLDFLSRLESLNICFSGEGLYPCKLSFPSSLKKLTLSKSCLPWDEISIISRLPSLEVLKLLDKAFTGPEWNMTDGEFQKLKFLKLVSLNFETWNNASSELFPHLEQLVLEHCSNLKEVPSAVGEIPSLRRIQMKLCNPIAVESVKQIETEQHEMGNDQFRVFISEK
ncbi:hypothetical protein M9H77_09128 [Catharanthus roseus]|uniref:Uncharacterized protein n=1 Tax=Catharanthus roseus TaxID=4058 RepID=A0ACC0C065_CATRO|nr:hypothetical protein M9H77_09128 [Catharanthus roseus]